MSCCGCLETPIRITNIFRHKEMFDKFLSVTGISIKSNTFICDPCVDLLDSAYSFKITCLEIHARSLGVTESLESFPEDTLIDESHAVKDELGDESGLINYDYEYIEDDDEPSMRSEITEEIEEDEYHHQMHDDSLILAEPVMEESKPVHFRRRTNYKAEEKLEAIKYAEKSSNRDAAKTLSIDESCIRKWRHQKTEIQNSSNSNSVLYHSDISIPSVTEHIEIDSEGLDAKESQKVVRSRKSYSSSQKLEVVKYAEATGNRHTAKIFNIDESCIRKWRLSKDLLIEIDRERGTKRKPNLHWPELDRELKAWALEQTNSGIKLKPSQIKTRSIQLAKSLNLTTFKGTSSYIFKFMERYHIPGRSSKSSLNKETL